MDRGTDPMLPSVWAHMIIINGTWATLKMHLWKSSIKRTKCELNRYEPNADFDESHLEHGLHVDALPVGPGSGCLQPPHGREQQQRDLGRRRHRNLLEVRGGDRDAVPSLAQQPRVVGGAREPGAAPPRRPLLLLWHAQVRAVVPTIDS